jgi:lipopolysaccharide export system permease protein
MILTKIWEKYIFYKTLKTLLLFFSAIFVIVIAVDFSIHGAKIFAHENISFLLIVKYYLNLFFIQLNLFLSLTFMLSCIKVLSDMNIHRELSALLAASISFKKLFRPFFIIAFIICIISYLNLELFYPKALNFKDNFKETYLKKINTKTPSPNVIYLEDSSKLIYQSYNPLNQRLTDVYLIKSFADIWHAKYLYLNKTNAKGALIDHFIREDNLLRKVTSYKSYDFEDIKLNEKTNIFTPLENRSIITLLKQSLSKKICNKEKIELLSNLNYKLATPLLPFLIIIAIFPYLIYFNKNLSIFFICIFSMFGFILYHTLMDSALILAENALFSPFVILWLPNLLTISIFVKRYKKL